MEKIEVALIGKKNKRHEFLLLRKGAQGKEREEKDFKCLT